MRRLALLLLFATAARGDFPLNTAPLLPSPYRCSEPAIVSFDGTQVVVWAENIRTVARIHARFLDGNDLIVGEAVCCTETVFAAANGHDLFIAAAGKLFRIDSARRTASLGALPAYVLDMAANDDSLLIVRSDQGMLKGSLLDRDGGHARDILLSDRWDTANTSIASVPGAYLLAFRNMSGGMSTLFVRSWDGVTGAPQNLASSAVVSPNVVADGSGFLLVWAVSSGASWDLMTRRLVADGTPAGPPRISTQKNEAFPTQFGKALVKAPDGFRLLMKGQNVFDTVQLARLAPDGSFVDAVDIGTTDDYATVALADDGSAFIPHREFISNFGIKLTRVGTDRSIADSVLSLTRPVQRTHALFAVQGGYAAVWSESYTVMFGRFTASGQPLDGDGIPIHKLVISDVSAACNGRAVMIAWRTGRDAGVPAMAFIPLADPQHFSQWNNGERQSGTAPGVTAAAGDFVVAWGGTLWDNNVYAQRISGEDGSLIDPHSRIAVAVPYQQFIDSWTGLDDVRVAWNGTNLLFTWQQMQRWDDGLAVGDWPREFTKGDPFAQLVSPSLVPIGAPIDLAHAPVDHSDYALNITAFGDGWLATWLRAGDHPAMFSERIDAAGGTTRDPIGGAVVPWGGAAIPPVLGATAFGALRANGRQFDSLLPDGRTLPVSELPENAIIDAVCLECPLPSIAYSLRAEDGSERAYVGALTARRHGAAGR